MAASEPTLPAGTLGSEPTLPAGFQRMRKHNSLDLPVSAGDVIDKWKLYSIMCEGRQSVLYFAGVQDQADTVVKIYQEEKKQNGGALRRLMMLQEGALVPLLSYGKHKQYSYEITPFLREGSLEGIHLSEETIRRVVLPQLTAALHTLHQMHILHNDVKPANLFWKKKELQIALGDYDCISLDSTTEDVGGTLAYMAPETLFSRGKIRSAASDYCSMGLTLITLLTGASPFAGKTEKEVMRMWQRELTYPENISPSLSTLLHGLVRYDPKSRMDYEAVQRWLKNDGNASNIVKKFGKQTGQNTKKLAPLLFHNQYILDIPELVEAIGSNWEYGTFMLRQHQLDQFLIQFDSSYYQICRQCTQMFDADEALFVLLQKIHPGKAFYWCGESYCDLEDFAERALGHGKLKNSSPAVHFCRAGLLEVYLEQNQADEEQLAFARRLQKLSAEDPDLALTQLLVSMNAHPEFAWHGETFYSLEDVAGWLLAQQDLDTCVEELYHSRKFEAWLDFVGQGKFIPEIKKRLEGIVL